MSMGLKQIKELFSVSNKTYYGYRKNFVYLALLGFFNGLLGVLGVTTLIPLFTFLTGVENTEASRVVEYTQGLLNMFGVEFGLVQIMVFIVTLFMIKAVILVGYSYLFSYILLKYEEGARSRLFISMAEADWQYLIGQKLGHLETLLQINIEQSSRFLEYGSRAIIGTTNLVAYFIISLTISYKISLVIMVAGLFAIVVLRPLTVRIRKNASQLELLNRDMAHFINESVLDMKSVKAAHLTQTITQRALKTFASIRQKRFVVRLYNLLAGVLIEPLSVLVVVSVFYFYYISGSFDLVMLIAVIYIIRQMFLFLMQTQSQFRYMYEGLPYMQKILDFEKLSLNNKEKDTGAKKFKFQQSLEMKGVGFTYKGGEKEVLSNLNVHLKKGDMVGIVGPSGSGKTTLVDLLLGLFVPVKGDIFLDGVNAKDISLGSWREKIGYVSQDIFLINDTIRNNIRYYNKDITDEQIYEASKKAQIYDFIKGLPEGFNTMVGERGALLSGGQRQRVGIARALARNPEILIFDEATSSLDTRSEKKIQEAIEKLKGDVTIIAIAHRLSTVRNSDKLVVLKDGGIVEQGKPEELLKDKTSYFFKSYHLR